MIDKKLIPVGGLKKEPFSGSHNGMRYYFQYDKKKDGDTEKEDSFSVYIYPEPWSFEKTPAEEIEKASFPFSEEGMDAAIAWLYEQFEQQKERWLTASKDAMHTVLAK